jgi:hypothetical protein
MPIQIGATTSTSVAAQPGTDLGAYRLAVGGVAAQGFSVSSAPASTAGLPAFVGDPGAAVNVALPGGVQPASPVTLSFSFNGKTPPRSDHDVVPAVAAVAEGSTETEVLPSHWDPATSTLTAQTQHFSLSFPVSVDLGALARQFGDAVNGFLGLSTDPPSCVGQALTVDDTTYTLDPDSVPAAWPCLSNTGGKIGVDLASRSPNAWVVRSDPAITDMGVELSPDVGYAISQTAYHTIFAAVVGNGTLLLPGSSTHLRFDASDPPQRIGLRTDPGAMLLNGLLVGLHALFPNAALLEIPGMVDCLKTTQPKLSTAPSTASIGADTHSLINCITSVTQTLSTKPSSATAVAIGTIAAKSLGAVLSLGPDISTQLAASLSGLVGEFTGANTQTINVHSDQKATPAAQTGPATLNLSTKGLEAGGGLMLSPDHFKLSARSHDKQGYYVDLSYRWTINRPPDSDLGYCKGHVTVTDGGRATVFHQDDDGFNACEGGGGWGAHIKVYNPGTYTVTADIDMERSPTLHGTTEFTVDPL